MVQGCLDEGAEPEGIRGHFGHPATTVGHLEVEGDEVEPVAVFPLVEAGVDFRGVPIEELSAGQIDRYFEDVRQSAMCLSTRGQIGEGRFDEFRDGLIRIKGYMYQRNYYIEHATVDAAKAACLATSFQRGVTDIPKYSQEAKLSELTIYDKMPKELQRLRRSLPEAFWYWARTYELL